MTDMTTTMRADVASRTSPFATIGAFFAQIGAGMREGSEIETRYRTLSRMTPSELAALGLNRADIVRAALTGTPKFGS